ncbi:MAG: hypothetical protein JSW50_10970 [Candidatus Latescibacterota bacterium]|nr:MAG: hypothetical protein JSW50_10970 [Candidatus Latescibacterota bacterium]
MNRIQLIQTLVFVCVFNLMACSADMSREPADLRHLLPQGDETGGWVPAGDAEIATGEDLYLVINGGAEIYHEYGFEAAVFQSYQRADAGSVNLEIYEMSGPAAAFGMYTFKTGREGTAIDLGNDGWLESYYLNFWKGNFVVTVIGLSDDPNVLDGVQAVAMAVDNKLEATSRRPQIVSFLPAKGLEANGVTYLKGNLALFNQYLFATEDIFGVREGVVGRYVTYSVFIFEYENRDESRQRFNRARDYFEKSARFEILTHDSLRVDCRDRDDHHLSMIYHQDWIVIVVGESQSATDGVFESLRFRSERPH